MINKALQHLKIEALNTIQQVMLQQAEKNAGQDVVLLSPTGSGKTLAFLLPLLQQLKADIEQVQVLIIVPSRELALQIDGHIV